jgi:hypothetical protein
MAGSDAENDCGGITGCREIEELNGPSWIRTRDRRIMRAPCFNLSRSAQSH